MSECVRDCVRVCVCVRAFVCVCVRACVHACMCERARACICLCVLFGLKQYMYQYQCFIKISQVNK